MTESRLRGLIEAVGVGMMTTHGRSGEFLARPMRLRVFEGDRGVWFLSRRDSRKVVNIAGDPRVGLTFVDLDGNAYVSCRGRATVEESREHVARLWSEQADDWFPEGKDSPGVVALAHRARRGRVLGRSGPPPRSPSPARTPTASRATPTSTASCRSEQPRSMSSLGDRVLTEPLDQSRGLPSDTDAHRVGMGMARIAISLDRRRDSPPRRQRHRPPPPSRRWRRPIASTCRSVRGSSSS